MILLYLFDLKDIGKQADAIRSVLIVLGMIATGIAVWLRWGRTRLRDSIRHWSYVQSVLAEERGKMEALIEQTYAEQYAMQERSLDMLRRSVTDLESRIEVLQRSLDTLRREREDIATQLQEHTTRLSDMQRQRDDCNERMTGVEASYQDMREEVEANRKTIEELREANRVLATTVASFSHLPSGRETS